MVETISPVVHGGRTRWLGTLALHTLGATVTAAVFGALLGVAGRALGAPWGRPGLLLLASAAALYALGALGTFRVPVPQLRRQVPDWWRTFFGRSLAAVLYGAGLGIGFLTYLSSGTLVVVALAAVASGRPAVGAAFMAPFGLVRGLSAIVAWRAVNQEASRALVDRLVASSGSARRWANAVALLVIASLAIVGAVRAATGSWWTLVAAMLAAVFTWAAISKVVRWRRWRGALAAYGLPSSVERAAAWAVPLGEAFVPLLVVVGMPRAAVAISAVLLAGFSFALIGVRRGGTTSVPCGCFGGRDAVDVRTVLARNLSLIVATVFVFARAADAPRIVWPDVPGAADLLPLSLAAGAFVTTVLVAWRASVWLARGSRA